MLDGHEFVKKVSPHDIAAAIQNKTDISFDIPIKPYEVSPQSNLNVFFGKGRESKNGLVKPRHWYEVELIVPKTITCQPGYPQSKTDDAEFDVITDDGWSFRCKVSGDYSKNFRSEGDLKILGKWLKGRLENAGVLKVGEPVTAETLKNYGRDTFTLTKTNIPGTWFLDFEV
ncbi:MAG: NgoFVII family restriction endonuclease [Clostridiales bacterium]|nr:NgoFVII family restriction endonuclease [Clostridiales bacterium]